MLKLYDYLPSQNAYKVRLLMNHLNINYETVPISIFEGDGQTEAFSVKNPTGAVPVLELEDGRTLPESNAILMYLAEDTCYFPHEPWLRAQVARWMFFEEDHVQNGLASLRHWTLTGKLQRRSKETITDKRTASRKTLSILDTWLRQREFLVDCGYTIADMAMFAYVAFSDEAGIPLADYPCVAAWVQRIRAQPGFLDTVYAYSMDPYSSNEIPAYAMPE